MESRNYFCTWNIQNFGRPDARLEKSADVFLGQDGARKARSYLSEESVFQSGGLADQYEEIRDTLYFLLDDGWDVPYGVHPDTQIAEFGSLILATDRFPSFQGTPAERLKKINEAFQKKGWKGAGLWVAAQAQGEHPDVKFLTTEESEAYWGERIRWCKEAGVEYWKVDWGCRQFEPAWREMINRLRDEIMPSLHIEHCHPAAAPVNHVVFEDGKQISDGRFKNWGEYPEKWAAIMESSEIFRSYDVLPQFSQASTVDRLATLMTIRPNAATIINCEDEVYLGAVLGCSLGIMRSDLCKEIPVYHFDPQNNSHRVNEVVRASNWQRIAPPIPIKDAKTQYSEDTVREMFTYRSGETWMKEYIGCQIYQACPSVIARGMDIPEIHYYEDIKPIVAAATHPNGAVSVTTLARSYERNVYKTPKAGIVLQNIQLDSPVGIFGHWVDVQLSAVEDLQSKRVWLRDLVGTEFVDITEYVDITGNKLCLTLSRLEQFIGNGNRAEDVSDPGFVIYIKNC